MNNNYKTLLSKHLLGKLGDTQIGTPEFAEVESKDASYITDIMNEAFPYGYYERNTLKCKDGYGNYNGITLVYGSYAPSSTETQTPKRKGYMLLLDENYQVLELITQFDSGTDLKQPIILETDEKGNLFGIDTYPSDDENNPYKRFIMLNNPSMKLPGQEHYTVKLRKSFITNGHIGSISPLYMNYAVKDPNSSSYYFGNNSVDQLGCGFELKIKVGSENEWNVYTGEGGMPSQQQSLYVISQRAYWDSNGDIHISIYRAVWLTGTNETYLYHGTNSGNTISYSKKINTTLETLIFNNADMQIIHSGRSLFTLRPLNNYSVVQINDDEFYLMVSATDYGISGISVPKVYTKCLYYDNGNTSIIFESTSDECLTEPIVYNELKMINNVLFNINYVNINQSSSYPFFYIKGSIITGIYDVSRYVYKTIPICTMLSSSLVNELNIVQVNGTFNLFTIFAITNDFDTGWTLYNTYTIYNSNNYYNGGGRDDYTGLYPQQSYLYNEDGRIIFARNMYDIILYNNTTEAILQVPNTMLNSITIAQQDLVGKSGKIIVSNEDDLEKNIYETLYINFFNTITMQNQNTEDYIDNLQGATRLNQSLLATSYSDYQNSAIGYVKINYVDETSVVKSIDRSEYHANKSYIFFTFTIYKEVESIEILSEDKETVYQRITNFNDYQIGHTYSLVQAVRVEI